MTVGKRIKAARQAAGLTQGQAAEKLCVSRQTVSNWENGKTSPDIDSVIRMSELYSVSLDDILKGEQPEEDGGIGQGDRVKLTVIILAVYLLLWGYSMFAQWVNMSVMVTAQAGGEAIDSHYLYDTTIYIFVLPVATFVMAAVIGKTDLWGRFKWLTVPVCGVLNMLPEYIPQAYYWYAANRPPLYPSVWGMLAGARASLFGLIGGILLRKRRDNQWIRGADNRKRVIITLLSLVLVLTTVYFTAYRSYMKWDYHDGVLTISGRGAADPDKEWQERWATDGGEVRVVVTEKGVTRLAEYMLDSFPNLERIVLSSTMNTVNSTMFGGKRLTEIEVDPENTGFQSIDGVLLTKGENVWLLYVPRGRTGSYTVPEGVKVISGMAFDRCTGLTEVLLPDSAERIMEGAFKWCAPGLEITIPPSVTNIEDGAIAGDCVIKGKAGTAAEEYAEKRGMAFVAVEYP